MPKTLFEKDEIVLIKQFFPNVNWQKVQIKHKLPWYMQGTFAAATVLPGSYFNKKLNIYFRSNYRTNSSIETLFHEAVHVQQYQNLDKRFPIGIGFFRCFMMHYFSWTIALFVYGILNKKLRYKAATRYAYFENPLEKEAYRKGNYFHRALISSDFAKESLIEKNPEIIVQKSDYSQSPPFWALFLSILLCFIIFVTKPILDFFAFCIILFKTMFKI